MTESYLPWITGAFGLIGALIGVGASVLTIYYQLRIQDRRALLRQAVELAQADYRYRAEHVAPGTTMPSIAVFIVYEVRLLKLMEKGRLRRLSAEHDELLNAAFDMAAAHAAAGNRLRRRTREGPPRVTARPPRERPMSQVIQNVSDTAFIVAGFRAAETEREEPLFRDPLAAKLAGDHGRKILATVPKSFVGAWSVALRRLRATGTQVI